MPGIKISKERLIALLEGEIRRQSGGSAPITITKLDGVIKTGEHFEIEAISLSAQALKVADFTTKTAPAGRGKIKLAAVDGERVL